jgi:hypothetical protein
VAGIDQPGTGIGGLAHGDTLVALTLQTVSPTRARIGHFWLRR